MKNPKLAAVALFFLFCLAVEKCWAQVIAPELQSAMVSAAPDEEIGIIVSLQDQVNLRLFSDGGNKLRDVVIALKSKADITQGSLTSYLKTLTTNPLQSLWIINSVAIKLPASLIYLLEYFPGIERISLDEVIPAPVVTPGLAALPESNLDAIRAPEVWSFGYTGQDVVVASIDTGVDVSHPDLTNRWRGGANSWFDPYGEHATPYDASGHGTQTMGILVGGDAGGSAIGVAPGARWIAVKGWPDPPALANLSFIHLGFQWLLDPDGNPDTNDAPQVVNNSWNLGPNDLHECIDVAESFRTDIQVLKAAGITVVFSAGNTASIAQPDSPSSESPANYPESFSVGAVDSANVIAGSSSRGPSSCDDATYPDVVAPGVSIKTSDTTFGLGVADYAYAFGTSFSAPHVTGAVALLLSALPNLTVSEIEFALRQTALDLPIDVLDGPDNAYGYGLVDTREALSLVLDAHPATSASLTTSLSSPQPAGTSIVFSAAGNGGTGIYQYRFWLKGPSTADTWQIVQDYSNSNTWTWDTLDSVGGLYTISVWVRNSGSILNYETGNGYTFQISEISVPPATGAAMSANPVSPREVGGSITFTANGLGGTGSYEYRFWLQTGTTWQMVQDYSTTNTWTWNTSGLNAGQYTVSVWVRSAGSAANYETGTGTIYTLVAGPVTPATGATISANPASPRLTGTTVTFTAMGSGGTGSFEYRYWLIGPSTGNNWQMVRDYASTNTWTWNTTGLTAGQYAVSVWVRSATSINNYETGNGLYYELTANVTVAATGATINATPSSPQPVGTSVNFAATGSGGSGSYEYRYWLMGPSTGNVWTMVQDYSTTPNWTWNTTGIGTGQYSISVWVRSAGSTNNYETGNGLVYTIN